MSSGVSHNSNSLSDPCLSRLLLELPLTIVTICSCYIAAHFIACVASCGMAYGSGAPGVLQAPVPGWRARSPGPDIQPRLISTPHWQVPASHGPRPSIASTDNPDAASPLTHFPTRLPSGPFPSFLALHFASWCKPGHFH
jgi:hypothetical protein